MSKISEVEESLPKMTSYVFKSDTFEMKITKLNSTAAKGRILTDSKSK